MVLTGVLPDPALTLHSTAALRMKSRRPSMEAASRESKPRRGRRPKPGTASESLPTRRASRSSILSEDIEDKMLLTSVRRSSRQRTRGILEDGWQENGLHVARRKSTASLVSNYSIVASKGELARSGYPVQKDTLAPGGISTRRNSLRPRGTSSPVASCRQSVSGKSSDASDEDLISTRSRKIKSNSRAIPKSTSIPAYLKEGLPAREKTRVAEEGILKKSSAFLASLAHTAGRISERKSSDSLLKPQNSTANGYRSDSSSKHSVFKGYFSILRSARGELLPLGRSSSVQTLPTGWKKKKKSATGVKKSVSFSSDTSFEEKRAPFRRSSVHEAKVYHKGVLQDRGVSGDRTNAKVPPSWESPAEGRSALLRAARDGDDAILTEIVTRVKKLGLGDMDVNVADSSGRTAISYMAGNGAAAMLEVALSLEGADPNIPDNEGNTPLHFAAQAGQTECLNILLQRCPDIEVDARNSSGFTPLMKAALQGRTKCAKILLFAGANPTLKDHGRGLRAEQWARFCGRYVCAEVIERFARHRLLERTTSCRWGSEPELAAKVLQGKVTPIPPSPLVSPAASLKSKIRKVFRTTSGPDRHFSLITQLTSAALCASSPALPKSGDVPPVVKSLLRPLSVPQLRVTLVSPQDFREKTAEKYAAK